MSGKESARQPWEATRAHVRKHDQIISREWGHVSSSDWAVLGSIFTACGLAIVLSGVLF